MGVSKQKAKTRRQKKIARKQKAKAKKKEIAKEGETKPSVSEDQAEGSKPGELIGTTAG